MNAIFNEQSGEAEALRDASRTLPTQLCKHYKRAHKNEKSHSNSKQLCYFFTHGVLQLTEREFQIDLQALLIF